MRTGTAVALLVALGGRTGAHWVEPERLVTELNGPAGRALGVERAVRDEKAPRLLVIRVGAGWYGLPAERRREQAAEWQRLWRHSVAQGVVSVLDARTDRPAVRFGAAGRPPSVAPDPKIAETPP